MLRGLVQRLPFGTGAAVDVALVGNARRPHQRSTYSATR